MNLPPKHIEEFNKLINSMTKSEIADKMQELCYKLIILKTTISTLDMLIIGNKFPIMIDSTCSLTNKKEAVKISNDLINQYKEDKMRFDILKKYVDLSNL